MPDIRLQDYTANIRELIRSVRLDEAIAHCQHILRHYPKYIEAYCLLGQACLEKEMYREAIEFFQQTLGADPENLMARVGLAVIYDEQGAVPEAIWQLERAFELLPGNAEVRRELLRLYGQHGDIDKTRLKLTRGALGRLYSRNGLYERAISEFRAVLRQDPELPDIRVALVEVLWREGRQVEAVEMCLDLLDALPNCLKANLILGDIWLRGGNEESARQRLSVARALDPENTVAQELMGGESPLPPEQVLIPELEVLPETFDFAPAGVAVGERAGETIAATTLDEEKQEPWGTDEELPDWLRDVGVTPEMEPALDLAAEEAVLEPPPEEALAAEEMPEWLQEVMGEEGLAPAGEPLPDEGEPLEEGLAVEEKAPEPLPALEPPEIAGAAALVGGIVAEGMFEEAEQELAGGETPAEEMPEWLEELLGEAVSPGLEEAAPVAEELAEPRVLEVEEEIAEPPVVEAEEEVREFEEEIAEPPVVEVEEEVAELEEGVLPAEEIPDWLRDLGVAEVEEIAEVETEVLAEPPVMELEEEGAELEEEILPAEEIPDWLRDLGVAEVEEIAEVETEVLAEPPVAEAEEEVAELEEEVLPAEEIPDWLRDLGVAEVEEIAEAETEVLAEPPVAEAEEEVAELEEEILPAEEIPDWLRDLGVAEVEEIAEVETEVLAEPPVAVAEEEVAELEEGVLPAEEIPDWLRDLGVAEVEEIEEVETEVLAEPPVAEAEEEVAELEEEILPAEEIPDWLRDLGVAEVQEVAEVETEVIAEPPVAEEVPLIDEIPDWLRDLDKLEVEEVSAPPIAEVEKDRGREAAVPASLLALVAAGLLDEADLDAAMAEMSDEELATQRAEEIPQWLSELVEEEAPAVTEAGPAPSVPFLQEAAIPATEMAVAEVVAEEAALEVEEPEPLIEEAIPEAAEPVEEVVVEEAALEVEEPEPLIEEAVPEAAEPVEEVVIEEAALEAVPEAAEPVEEVVIEEAVPEAAEPAEEVVIEEAVPEVAELVEEAAIEEAVAEAVLEAAELVEEVVIEEAALEVEEPEPLIEEAIPEAAELVEEVVIEEAVPEAAELVEEVVIEEAVAEAVPEAVEPVEEVPAEEPVLEVPEEEIEGPSRADELLKQLKTRPRDYSARLELARLRYAEQEWDAALTNYEKLISARRFLPDVIDDLESLVDQQVEAARVYHMLGDAYMQQDQLDEALKMYRLARQRLTKR